MQVLLQCLSVVLVLSSPLVSIADEKVLRLESLGAALTVRDGGITALKADCSQFTPDDFELIGSIETLTSISLSGKSLDDEQFEKLSPLVNLESMLLNNAQISDEGFKLFKPFQKLNRLSIFHHARDNEDFDGSGLAHLKGLSNLRRLTFAGATSGNAYLKAIAKIQQLEEFSEWHNWETRDGFQHLTSLSNLKALKVGQRLPHGGGDPDPSLDDVALRTISQLQSLERLELQEARLTFAGLSELKSLPHLRTLKMKWVDIPKDDLSKIEETLVEVKIEFTELTKEEAAQLLQKKLRL